MLAVSLPPRFAVLIDAENTRLAAAQLALSEVEVFGTATVRRIYGDFSNPALQPWRLFVGAHGFSPRQHFPAAKGKNGADIALVIDAMDLLHSRTVDGFCLVSSDSDFTGLAVRLREAGTTVLLVCEGKATASLRQACHRVVCVDEVETAKTSAEKAPAAVTVAGARAVKPTSAALGILTEAVAAMAGENGWASLGPVGQRLRRRVPGFDTRDYGCTKLVALFRASGAFDIEQDEGGRVRVRLKASSHQARLSPGRAGAAKPAASIAR